MTTSFEARCPVAHYRTTAAPAPPSRAPELPPGPSSPSLVQTFRWFKDPIGFLEQCRARYGSRFTLRARGRTWLLLSDPRDVKALFTSSPEVFLGGRGNRSMDPILGSESTLTLDGEAHRAQRRLSGPPLRAAARGCDEAIVRDVVDDTLARWPVNEVFPVARSMGEITREVFFRAIFGVTRPDRLLRLHAATARMSGKLTASLALLRAFRVDLGRHSPWGRFLRARRELRAVLQEEIDDVRAGRDPSRADPLAAMARGSTGDGRGDEVLHTELLTLLFAGHESTSATLPWALQWILGAPYVLGRVKEEVRAGRPAGELPYLGAVVAETLRMTPPFLLSIRHVAKDAALGDMVLPAGTDVAACIPLVHRDPTVYTEPNEFRPERFLGSRPTPFEYLPYGGGGRMCVGASFASSLIVSVLARVLARADLELEGARRQRPVLAGIALFPADGTPVRLRAALPRRDR